jgi:hypothetical protein
VLWSVLIGAACDATRPGPRSQPETNYPVVVLGPAESLEIPRSVQLTIESGGGAVRWESSNPAVASVSQTGRVATISPGTATITARRGTASGTFALTVVPTALVFRISAVRLAVDERYEIEPIVLDANHSILPSVPVSWHSEDTSVVSVGAASGVLTGRKVGSTVIIATTSSLQATLRVVVGSAQQFDVAFTRIASVGNYGCGLEAVTNLAYCWGDNHSGALGIGGVPWREGPMAVDEGKRRFYSLSVSAYYNCALEVGTNHPYCWGLDPTRGVGVGPPPNEGTVPTLVAGGRFRFSAISAGTEVACGIEVDTRRGYCWGAGELTGEGTGIRQSTPTRVGGAGSDLRFASISASPGVVCGIEADTQRAYCWGRNLSGQLGDGTTTPRLAPTLVGGPAIRFGSISAGATVVCGLESGTGRAYCWGANEVGQLGDGTTNPRLLPTAVAGDALQFSSIDAGPHMACAVEAITDAAYCWGRNLNGSLGDGTRNDRRTPTLVSGGLRFASVSTAGAGGEYGGVETCGIQTATGRAYCWGFSWLTPRVLEVLPP